MNNSDFLSEFLNLRFLTGKEAKPIQNGTQRGALYNFHNKIISAQRNVHSIHILCTVLSKRGFVEGNF